MMAWGLNAAPNHFNYVITTLIDESHRVLPRSAHRIYLNYCTLRGQSMMQYGRNSLVSLYRLPYGGMPINFLKSSFLTQRLEILSIVLKNGQMQFSRKFSKMLIIVEIPTTLKDLQRLLGKLNLTNQFIPDYRKKVASRLTLVGKSSDGVQRQSHTEPLNNLLEQMNKRIRLGVIDILQPYQLHVDYDE